MADPYQGEVVILVDELVAPHPARSFPAAYRPWDNATIVGSQTPGVCLVMNIVSLPEGAILAYPYGQSQTPDG